MEYICICNLPYLSYHTLLYFQVRIRLDDGGVVAGLRLEADRKEMMCCELLYDTLPKRVKIRVPALRYFRSVHDTTLP